MTVTRLISGLSHQPDEFSLRPHPRRARFQVNRLQEHLVSGEENPLATSAHLIEQWYLVGPAPAMDAVGLDRRFERAQAALNQMEANAQGA